MSRETVFIVYSKLDENYGAPFKVFSTQEELKSFLRDNKDAWGLEYCWEEIEVDA